MKFLFLFLAICHLSAATVTVPPASIGGDAPNSCPPQEKLDTLIERIRNSTKAALSFIHGRVPQCGDGIWYQIVAINMSSADSQCPDGWVEENEEGVRACGRGSVGPSCQSVLLNSEHRMRYSRVCGRAIGYQYGSTDAFLDNLNDVVPIDQPYVDGLSITYGSPRQHIWTFAAGHEVPAPAEHNCPCSAYPGVSPPPYVGNNWYCESGTPDGTTVILYPDDPLWDGEDCRDGGTCCSMRNGNSPPWFSVDLPAPTSDYVEARICSNELSDTQEDTFINIFEIYIQ